MANKIQIKDFSKTERRASLHVLPCSIEYDGPANVSSFFPVDITTTTPSPELRAHFRGRALDGQLIKIPEDCEGIVLTPGEGFHETEGSFYEVQERFNEAVVWQHDRIEGVDDTIHRALSWIDLAASIHDE